MFRKKNPVVETPEPAATPRPETAEDEPKPPARRAAAIPARPLGSSGFPIDIGRRVDAAGVRSDPSSAAGRDKWLIVGKDVRMKGEVPACEKLIVDGDVEMQLSGCRVLQIGASGVFRGSADVVEAEIAGRFEGEITTRERLAVRATGRVAGTIRYGQITIDAGGQVTGEISGQDAATPPPVVDGKPDVAASPSSTTGLSFAATDRP
jgi:cytoskeletal protein CcmA (bactofilin family)